MKINCKQLKNILIIKISGEIDHHCIEDIREYIDSQFRQTRCINMIFDFSNVSFMDSSGIGMLIGRYKNAGMLGGKIIVCSINDTLERIFKISGLCKIITIKKDMEESLEYLENWGGKNELW